MGIRFVCECHQSHVFSFSRVLAVSKDEKKARRMGEKRCLLSGKSLAAGIVDRLSESETRKEEEETEDDTAEGLTEAIDLSVLQPSAADEQAMTVEEKEALKHPKIFTLLTRKDRDFLRKKFDLLSKGNIGASFAFNKHAGFAFEDEYSGLYDSNPTAFMENLLDNAALDPADGGNCLFRCFSQAILGKVTAEAIEFAARQLRRVACTTIEKHAAEEQQGTRTTTVPLMTDKQMKAPHAYVKSTKMGANRTWATQVEIQALATALGKKLIQTLVLFRFRFQWYHDLVALARNELPICLFCCLSVLFSVFVLLPTDVCFVICICSAPNRHHGALLCGEREDQGRQAGQKQPCLDYVFPRAAEGGHEPASLHPVPKSLALQPVLER